MRLIEVLQRSADFLEHHQVPSPRLHAELILAHILGLPRLRLYLEFERVLTTSQLDAARAAVLRRARREPLQHILGSTSFCGLELAVSPAALIPRPETELLAQRAWEWIAQNRPHPPVHVLDWGTGTGCLAIAIALHAPHAQVTALDLSPAALELARDNAARHGCTDRIRFVQGDGCAALDPDATFDLVVSNPPYIASAEIRELEPEVRDFDPVLALDGGADGLALYRRLARELATRVKPGAAVLLEFGDGQSEALGAILVDAGWILGEVHRDYSGRERFLLALRKP